MRHLRNAVRSLVPWVMLLGLLCMSFSFATRPAAAASTTKAYIANFNSPTITVINTSTNAVETSIVVPHATLGAAVTPNGKFAYFTEPFHGTVLVIDTQTDTLLTTVAVQSAASNFFSVPFGLPVTPNGKFVYVATTFEGVWVINTKTNTVVTNITAGFTSTQGPTGIAITPDGGSAYVTNDEFSGGTVSVIDTQTNTVVKTISVGSSPEDVAASRMATWST
jgi:YVTN family beta-propeller protein